MRSPPLGPHSCAARSGPLAGAGVGALFAGEAVGSAGDDARTTSRSSASTWCSNTSSPASTPRRSAWASSPQRRSPGRVSSARTNERTCRRSRPSSAASTVPSPTFNYRGVTSDEQRFVKTAVAFEDLTAALLEVAGATARLALDRCGRRDPALGRDAARRLDPAPDRPEARHDSPSTSPPRRQRMARLIASTGFVASRPRMARRAQPRFTG